MYSTTAQINKIEYKLQIKFIQERRISSYYFDKSMAKLMQQSASFEFLEQSDESGAMLIIIYIPLIFNGIAHLCINGRE